MNNIRYDSSKEYRNAKKMGERELLYWQSRGKDGYLPALEEILKDEHIISEVSLGIIEVPIKKVKGTLYRSRKSAFAKNFMPLLEEDTEFAIKWMNLFEAQQEEGIRDAIIAYEYLNKFYVVEGNKRASVLKYLDSPSIMANVKRLVPKYDEMDLNIRIYYEFLEFYDKTKINMIWFKREGGFKELEKILFDYIKKNKENPKEFFRYFEKSIYWNFRKIYHELNGEKLPITTGEAFLYYLKKYGIEKSILDKELKLQVRLIIKELEDIYIEGRKNIFHDVFLSLIKTHSEKHLNIAFLYRNRIEESTWVKSHDIGRKYLEERFKDKVTTFYIENVEKEKSYDVIKELVEQNYDLIITTSFDYMDSTYKAAIEFPNIKFLNCAGYKSYRNLSVYFGRIYQPKFLSGILAGTMTKSNKIGYIAPYPLPLFIRSLNAFALGVKMVNPKAKIIIKWTKEWINKEIEEKTTLELINKGIDILSSNMDTLIPLIIADKYNIYNIGYNIKTDHINPKTYLAAATWNWGPFYEKIIKKLLNDEWVITSTKNREDLRKYWYGMDRKIVRLYKSKSLIPGQTEKLVGIMKHLIKNREFDIFSGPIYDHNNNLIVDKNESIMDEDLLKIDWYLDNVEGELERVIFSTDKQV
ncbi:Basic membrane lipoprotein Med, substrate-binding protein (PBP1-ABC) superfamily [Marinitoga hydrogenitolerans DSM 16785]|uniref:Basic membrane lipoprotein Med, substrate-binding protein (PBP1-ABC) superfamily n=1 Tax=Marinitoga hydrogenitolerans (strain DSM 16785 / JCM 12826 / AT1271) TaxID=1122195 RepID=A0A1M4V946_MARH1|nr:BMP family ABC transporter substrate-binding protein [Marinitoga hydrogenitolerans]SHE65516.1 Basic membrane lipoprotein Med, substrate-binding protein (PBP1-ABC) superfamily [Marinitoga hydrogenitolerans DSM 16785]